MIVVDANILLAACLKNEAAESVERVKGRDPVWCAPEIWRAEIANALCTRMRRKTLTLAQANAAYLIAERGISQTFNVSTDAVLEVSSRTGCTGYDSSYVAVAERRQMKLVTLDVGVLSACPHVAVTPEQFLAA